MQIVIGATMLLGMLSALLSPAAAQESPADLTTAERRCQDVYGKSATKLGTATALCLTDCATSPSRRCSTTFPDPVTADCLGRARAAAEVSVLRACPGAACPECYAGGNCSSFSDSQFSNAMSLTETATRALYCDDSFSPDGLTAAEQRCQRGIGRSTSRFAESYQRCLANCEKGVRRGTTDAEQCRTVHLDTPAFDARTQRCIDRARARQLESCSDKCPDPPECFPLSCAAIGDFADSQLRQLQPVVYCEEPGVCGDGRRVPSEVCDGSATPSGCPDGTTCRFCGFCEIACSNGQVDPGEVCDTNVPSSCGSGTICRAGCDLCVPVLSQTEDITPCDARVPVLDLWRFGVSAGQDVVVRVDTVDFATASVLRAAIRCANGQAASGFFDIACSFSPPFNGLCPLASFTATSDTTCDVQVDVFLGSVSCADRSRTRYRIDVTGSQPVLVSDDVVGSPGGAFVMPAAGG